MNIQEVEDFINDPDVVAQLSATDLEKLASIGSQLERINDDEGGFTRGLSAAVDAATNKVDLRTVVDLYEMTQAAARKARHLAQTNEEYLSGVLLWESRVDEQSLREITDNLGITEKLWTNSALSQLTVGEWDETFNPDGTQRS